VSSFVSGASVDGSAGADNAVLDGLFLDMYGTLTAADRAAVEEVCRLVIADTSVQISAPRLAVVWGERFFAELDHCNDERFQSLLEIEARTLRLTMAELGADIDPWPYARLLTEYWRNPPLQPEVPAFLAEFPLPICIVSNADRDDLACALERHAIRVAAAVTSEEVRAYKPSPKLFLEALRRTGWDRQRVLHVGDSLHSDVGGAKAAGLRSGWVNRAHRIHDIGTHRPDYEFADLMELLELVRSLQRGAQPR
jgi:2-haloalkanoic acid dehalogenase type II